MTELFGKHVPKTLGTQGNLKGPGDQVDHEIDMRVKAWKKKTVLINKLIRTYLLGVKHPAWCLEAQK